MLGCKNSGKLRISKPDLIFLISAPYSGATLLSILMNQHPAVSSDGEIFPYDIRGENVVCSCGRNQIDCEYYRRVANCMMKADKKGFHGRVFYYVPKYSTIHYLSRALEGFWISPFPSRIRKIICSSIPKYRRLVEDFVNIPIEWINKTREDIKIVYWHTSHGSQLTTGMQNLDLFMGDNDFYDFDSSGVGDILHYHEPNIDYSMRDLTVGWSRALIGRKGTASIKLQGSTRNGNRRASAVR